jgi:DNA-binding transcriptional ArsR family regulator
MAPTRTTQSELVEQGIESVLAALEAAGIRYEPGSHAAREKVTSREREETVIDVLVDDRSLRLAIKVVAYCTGQFAAKLVSESPTQTDRLPFVVADRITSQARMSLSDAGWSWLDRRGQLHLRGPGVRVDLAIPASQRATASIAAAAIAGRSGITVAYWLSSHPGEGASPTRDSANLRLAPSTISTTLRRLAEAGLVDDKGVGVAPELFWELAAAWHTERTWLIDRPEPAHHVPIDPLAPTWRATGTAAAAAYGAPITSAGDGPLDLYVIGPVEVSIATRRYGAASPGAGRAAIAVPPTPLVTERREGEDPPTIDRWPAAPLVAVALDLAQDTARGREILEQWSAGHGVWL